jgi:predicted metal-dependent peptidase
METRIRILIVLDSSGSMSDEECKECFATIKEFKRDFAKVILINHDTSMAKPIELKPTDNIEKHAKLYKRGGTSHRDVFDWIENECEWEKVSLVMFFTDMESDQDHLHESKKYHFYDVNGGGLPCIWVTHSNRHTPPFGEKIYIENGTGKFHDY